MTSHMVMVKAAKIAVRCVEMKVSRRNALALGLLDVLFKLHVLVTSTNQRFKRWYKACA